MKNSFKVLLLLLKQYSHIGGQAVIEGVMMKSSHASVVAVRRPDGSIHFKTDDKVEFPNIFSSLNKIPFLRGVFVMLEEIIRGVIALNYSAYMAIDQKTDEKADSQFFFTIISSLLLGVILFVALPHFVTMGLVHFLSLNWDLNGFGFHFVDGVMKAFLFITYIWAIGHLPEIKRLFQYHGAEHKALATFKANEALEVSNAKKFSILHPLCGSSLLLFVFFISIIIFSALFALLPIGDNLPPILKHPTIIAIKVLFMLPVAGLSYEAIKFSEKHSKNFFCKLINALGMLLQKLTTKEPDSEQLEVALSSIKKLLEIEGKYKLKGQRS